MNKEIIHNLSSFSKHLMLLVAAIFAFSASNILSSHSNFAKILFVVSLAFALASFFYGHLFLIKQINLYWANPDKKEENVISAYNPLKNRVVFQFRISLFSILFLIGSICIHAFTPVPVKDDIAISIIKKMVENGQVESQRFYTDIDKKTHDLSLLYGQLDGRINQADKAMIALRDQTTKKLLSLNDQINRLENIIDKIATQIEKCCKNKVSRKRS